MQAARDDRGRPHGEAARPTRSRFAKHWRVENGELVNDGNGAYLTTDKDYGDIELLIEYKTVAKADSGIYLRGHAAGADLGLHQGRRQVGPRRRQGLRRAVQQQPRRARQGSARPGRQAVRRVEQLPHPPGRRARHGLPERQARRRSRPPGELLGPQAARCRSAGPIQLQTHGGEIRWRNIFVREIPPAEANAILRKHDARRLQPTSSTARTSPAGPGRSRTTKSMDGAIVCKPKKGGNIYTKEEYGDFVARLEFKLPPGGNNGLAIRYPGEGTAAVRRHVRGAGPRRHRPEVRQARPAAVQRLGLRHGRRRTAATCGRSASGTSWR